MSGFQRIPKVSAWVWQHPLLDVALLSVFSISGIITGWMALHSHRSQTYHQLLLKPQQVNLGELSSGDRPDFTVQVVNATSFDATGLKLVSSCGCTESRINSLALPTGQSTTIQGTFDPGKRVGSSSTTLLLEYDLNGRHVQDLVTIEAVVRERSS